MSGKLWRRSAVLQTMMVLQKVRRVTIVEMVGVGFDYRKRSAVVRNWSLQACSSLSRDITSEQQQGR